LSIGMNRIVILSEAKDLCNFATAIKIPQKRRCDQDLRACKLPRRVRTDLSCPHNLPWCMRS